jgi:hypothetical protein
MRIDHLRCLGTARIYATIVTDPTIRNDSFQILGEAEADLFGLMGQLIERMRRTLAQQHLEKDDQLGLVIKDSLVRGRIAWDSNEEGRVPLLVIDGQEVSWEKFDRMVMGFEGWQFKFEIRDRSEEV